MAFQQLRLDQARDWSDVAVESYRAAGMNNHAALELCELARFVLLDRARPDLALAILRSVRTDRWLSWLVRGHAANLAVLAIAAKGRDPAGLLARPSAHRFTRWGCWRVSRELPPAVRRVWRFGDRARTELQVRHGEWSVERALHLPENMRWL